MLRTSFKSPETHAPEDESVVVILSGGQDSTTCLFWALHHYTGAVHCVTYNYGQRHYRELEAAEQVVAFARSAYPDREITHETVVVGNILKGTSPLVSDENLEQYEDYASLPGGLEKTFVPMRNQLFLTLAANHAFVKNSSVLVTGVCQEDNGGYPDCRRTFIDAFTLTTTVGTFVLEAGFPNGIVVETPLMYLSKAESVHLAMQLPFAYPALGLTHTAYDGQYPPVGKDHATLLREKGFVEAGVPDPLVLRAVAEGLMEMPTTPNYSESTVSHVKRWFGDLAWPENMAV